LSPGRERDVEAATGWGRALRLGCEAPEAQGEWERWHLGMGTVLWVWV
jgi:hypothetical protein